MARVRHLALGVAIAATACLSKPSPPGACPAGSEWSSPRPLDAVNSASDELAPWLSPDRHDLYFSSTRAPRGIYHARWDDLAQDFGAAVRLSELAPELDDAEPFLSDDQTTIWFALGSADPDTFKATRLNKDSPFGTAIRESNGALDSNARDFGVDLTPDLRTVVTSSNRDDEADLDLFLSTRSRSDVDFPAPVRIAALARPGVDCCGTLGADGTTLLYETDRGGSGVTIWETTRADTSVDFPEPHIFAPFADDTSSNGGPQLSRDGNTVVFASDRGGASTFDLYIVDRCN